ncbi:hypothetical protein [Clostridium sp. DL1XJH146]
MKKKIIISTLLIFLIALFGTYIYMTPVDINKSYTGVIYSNNKDTTKNVKIDFNGTLRKNPFSSDIIVSEVNFDDLTYQVEFTQNSSKEYVGYLSIDTKEKYNILGSIVLSKDLEEIFISSDDVNSKYKDIYYVVSPIENKEKVEKVFFNYLSPRK